MIEFIRNIKFVLQSDLLYAVIRIVRQACDRLAHHRLIMCRIKCISMGCRHKSCWPCQICFQPDVFEMAQTIVFSTLRVKNHTVDLGSITDRGRKFAEAHLIITITALCLQLCIYTANILFFCLNCIKGQISICSHCQLLIVTRCFGENIIRMIRALEQGIFSFIFCFIFFSAVCYCDRHRIIICDLSEAT